MVQPSQPPKTSTTAATSPTSNKMQQPFVPPVTSTTKPRNACDGVLEGSFNKTCDVTSTLHHSSDPKIGEVCISDISCKDGNLGAERRHTTRLFFQPYIQICAKFIENCGGWLHLWKDTPASECVEATYSNPIGIAFTFAVIGNNVSTRQITPPAPIGLPRFSSTLKWRIAFLFGAAVFLNSKG